MALNPYATFLGARPALPVLAATTAQLRELAGGLTAEQLEAPRAPGKWSPKQILAHLADCELVFAFRLRQTLAAPVSEPAVIQPFDQDVWALRYAGYDVASALATFAAMREWNLRLIATLAAGDAERVVTHPERGTMTFQTIVETMAGHDLNHLEQLAAVGAG